MATLEQAIAIAAQAHEGQFDKSGEPYILHPLRMMLRASTLEAKIAAVLHDVVEDTYVTIDALQAKGFSAAVRNAIEAVTKREGEPYLDFVARASRDPIAREVKRLDLEDNMSLLRLAAVSPKDLERLAKYHAAWTWLRDAPPPPSQPE
jgi:(p)ppGpp synthase/HD superfamily hydrolase